MGDSHLKKREHAIIMAVILIVAMVMISRSHWLASLELKTVDARTRWLRKDLPAPADIILVLIDEASLKSMQTLFGRWPWPRRVFADIIDFLSNSGAERIMLDVLFTERQLSSEVDMELSEDDHALVSSTRNARVLYHSSQFNQDPEDEHNRHALNRPLPETFIQKFAVGSIDSSFFKANSYYLPFKELFMASMGVGVVSIEPDSDGVYRRLPPLVQYDQYLFPSFSLTPLFFERQLKIDGSGTISTLLTHKGGERPIPLEAQRNFFINMYGKFDAYSFGGLYLSLMKIRQGDLADLPVSPKIFTGKTVFIGASAAGVEDLKHTALGPQTPGVCLHASAYGNIISNDMLKFMPGFIQPLVMSLMVLTSVSALFFADRIYAKILWPLLVVSLWELGAVVSFSQNMCAPMAGPPLAVLCAYLASLTQLSFTEGRERRKIRNVLKQYVSPAVLAKVLENPSEEFMRAEVGSKEELTIFFSDIRGFTSLAERYPVEKIVELLNNYLSAMTDVIFHNYGTLDKFIGDAIVAFWGAPLRDAHHPLRSVQCALEMRKALSSLNKENMKRALPQLSTGIGIHTDHVILGNIGSQRKLDYTIIGDGVNLASRLEGLTKMYNTPILISQSTYERICDDICCRTVDYVKVKGKEKPIRVYSALAPSDTISQNTLEIVKLTEAAFDLYTRRNFSGAIKLLSQILERDPNDFLTTMLLFRCREYQRIPPPESWDGYYRYHTK